MVFKLTRVRLPLEGYIPGSKAGKKEVVFRRTLVYVIEYEGRYTDFAYLDQDQARSALANMEATVGGATKRHIPFETFVAWNFKYALPLKVMRPKKEERDGTAFK